MEILIAGLGLIGGSLAKSLIKSNNVGGYDRENVIKYAIKNKIINEKAKAFDTYDFVIVALPPLAAIEFIDKNDFKEDAIIIDICGVKNAIEKAINFKSKSFNYVGCHPMAGKEVNGIENSTENLFIDASLIITENEYTNKQSVEVVENLLKQAGFKKIIKCSSNYHDKVIAYTSQLAHLVSNAYVKSDTVKMYDGFTGGSFQDMTRIAELNEDIWTELFFLNRENLLNELKTLINSLKIFENALTDNNELQMKDALKLGRIIKQNLKKNK
jgi:prephenate dehydrogenase